MVWWIFEAVIIADAWSGSGPEGWRIEGSIWFVNMMAV